MSNKSVFISYSHDSAEHRERVLQLSQRLRADGVDAQIDQYVEGSPEKGWPRWMLDQLDSADFVLVVCTETYYRRFRGHEEPGRGKGADWEGALITQEMYDRSSETTKFVPVFIDEVDTEWIPEPLRSFTYYPVTRKDGYESLYDFLLGQAGVEPEDLGAPRRRPRRTAEPLEFDTPPPEAPQPRRIEDTRHEEFSPAKDPRTRQFYRDCLKRLIRDLHQSVHVSRSLLLALAGLGVLVLVTGGVFPDEDVRPLLMKGSSLPLVGCMAAWERMSRFGKRKAVLDSYALELSKDSPAIEAIEAVGRFIRRHHAGVMEGRP